MSESCNSNCSSCGKECSSRTTEQAADFAAKANEHSNVRHVIGVVSGKGGVGKSFVSSMLSVMMRRHGFNTAVLDADITGPSIPKSFGIKELLNCDEEGIIPAVSTTGVKLVSLNLMLPNETDPVVWRGPVIAGAVKQFWTDVKWGDVDFMFVDMPPGTGDVPLTVFQSLPISGIVIVTSPQELVGMIVEKAVRMAQMMNVPVLGLVENMSYFVCDNCSKKHFIFGESKLDEIAERNNIKVTARLPINPDFASACDMGKIEMVDAESLSPIVNIIREL